MVIDPVVWPVACKYARAMVAEKYRNELEIFDEVEAALRAQFRRLAWSFSIEDRSWAGLRVASDIDLVTSTALLVIACVLTQYPLATRPSRDTIRGAVDEAVSRSRCEQPSFKQNIKEAILTLYRIEPAVLTKVPGDLIRCQKVTNEGTSQTERDVMLDIVERSVTRDWSQWSGELPELVIQMTATGGVWWTTKGQKGNLDRMEALFLRVLLEKRAATFGQLDELIRRQIERVTPENRTPEQRIQKIKSRLCKMIPKWLADRIVPGAVAKSYTLAGNLEFIVPRRGCGKYESSGAVAGRRAVMSADPVSFCR